MYRERLEKFKIPIALSLVGIILIIGGMVASGTGKQYQKAFPKESLVTSSKDISVDVSGAVNKPGVYEIKENSRVEDAIKEAGGLTESANKEYISKYLNLAQKLSDGSKVYVPLTGEVGPGIQTGSSVTGVTVQAKVNINTSTQAELEALPGIGPVTASKIISGRPYQSIEDILNQKIVSKSTYEKIKDSLVVY